MPKQQTVERLCDNLFSVSVNWENLFELRFLSRTDSSVEERYGSILKKLVDFGTLSFDSENNYEVNTPRCDGGGCQNPKLEGKTLYFAYREDAEKVKKRFAWSTMAHYDS